MGEHLATKRLSRPPPAGCPEGEGPPDGSDGFKLLKRFKLLENEPIFQNINIFLARKLNFFNENFQEIELLQRFLKFLKNYFTNFKFYGAASKS